MNNLGFFFRNALRSLRRQPVVTLAAVVTLALGIGATTAIYSMLDRMVLNPVVYHAPSRLVAIWPRQRPHGQSEAFPVGTVRELLPRLSQLQGTAFFKGAQLSLGENDHTEALEGLSISESFLPLLGIRPMLGRNFNQAEDTFGGPEAVILGYRLWQRRFNSDPAIVGRRIRINGTGREVVGVLGPEMLRDVFLWDQGLFVPLAPKSREVEDAGSSGFLIGRLKDGVTLAAAQQDLARAASLVAAEHPQAVHLKGAWMEDFRGYLTLAASVPMMMFLGIVALVLVVACSNVASLLLAKGLGRLREMATRVALGADRGQLIGQMLCESLLLALLGAAGSLLVCWAVMAVFPTLLDFIADILVVRMDTKVFAATTVIGLISVLLFGGLPAWRVSQVDPAMLMKDGAKGSEGRPHQRLRRAVIVFQVAVAAMVLVSAGLLVRSLSMLQAHSPGFQTKGLMGVNVLLPTSKFPTPADYQIRLKELTDRVKDLPGVQSVALASNLPMAGGGMGPYHVEGQSLPDGQSHSGYRRRVSEDYFQTLGVTLQQGRSFHSQDTDSVCMVSVTLAQKHWPNGDPIGKRISIAGPTGPWLSVVGVASPTRQAPGEPFRPEIYVPIAHSGFVQKPFLLVRTSVRPESVIGSLRDALAHVDRDVALLNLRVEGEIIQKTVPVFVGRISGYLAAGFGLLVMVLAGVGLLGVQSFTVALRTREIGIRMALGASTGGMVWMVLKDGLLLTALGLALGIPAGMALGRGIASQLVGITPTDPLTLAGVAVVLVAVSVLSCLGPALRAARIQPSQALREG